MTARGPLSRRLVCTLFIAQALCLAGFAVAVFLSAKSRFARSFDDMLRGNAAALAALVEDDEDSSELEFEFGDDVMPGIQRPKRPDLFAILTRDGRLLRKATRLETLPAFVTASTTGDRFHDFTFRGHPYRGVVSSASRASYERPGQTVRSTVFFGRSLRATNRRLASLRTNLVLLFVVTLALSGVLMAFLASRGLAPLRRLADDTEALDVHDLRRAGGGRRLSADGAPREIHALATSFNALLDRIDEAFEREHRFATDAAHELRTPVATLKSGVQAALLRVDPSTTRETLEQLLIEVDRLGALCESLLSLSEARTAPLDDGIAACAWWTDVEVTAHAAVARHPGRATLRADAPDLDDWPRLGTTAPATRSIMNNLVENAVAHAGGAVRIAITAHREPTAIRLSVTDDGPGIDPAFRPRLFDRFSREDGARAHGGGAGLGLAICDAMARAHGGQLDYEAVAPHGSRFTWTIRVVPDTATLLSE